MTTFTNNEKLNELYGNETFKSVYDKTLTRKQNEALPVHIFGSSSDGNSTYLKPYHVLIDLGLPTSTYKKYNPQFFLDVDYIILTHHHGDHLNEATLRHVLENYPHMRIYISEFMWRYIRSNKYQAKYIKRKKGTPVPLGHNAEYETNEKGELLTEPHPLHACIEKHLSKFTIIDNAKDDGYVLTSHDGNVIYFKPYTVKHGDIVNLSVGLFNDQLKCLYASDLDNLGGGTSFIDCFGDEQHVTGLPTNEKFNLLFLEANYDEAILNEYMEKLKDIEDDKERNAKKVRAEGNLRHISENEARSYLIHLDDDGLFIPLHASRSFGTLYQE